MPKRSHTASFGPSRVFLHRNVRQHRRHGHFTFGHPAPEAAMQVDGGAHAASGKAKHHAEAELVPGLGPLEWGFPNSIITKLRYCDVYTLTSTTGATTSRVFRANGCNDPDYTGVGHQPMFWDQWTAIYNYYCVLGSKIHVTFKGTSSYSTVVCLQGSSTTSLSSTVSTYLEQNNGVHTIVGPSNTMPEELFMTYSPLEQMGQEVKNDGSSMTAVGADPSAGEGTYYYGLLATTSDAASTSTVDVIVEIEYTVKFSELSKNSGS